MWYVVIDQYDPSDDFYGAFRTLDEAKKKAEQLGAAVIFEFPEGCSLTLTGKRFWTDHYLQNGQWDRLTYVA